MEKFSLSRKPFSSDTGEVHSWIKDKYIVAGFSSLDLQMGNPKETKKAQMIGSILLHSLGETVHSL